jgi:AhpD family alkylhydroperoxidase
LQNRKASVTAKEREVINLVVSQINLCEYCIPAHTVIAKMQGFTDEQIIEIRKVAISFNTKLASLAVFVKEVTLNRGKPSSESIQNFFEAGYDNAALIDVCMIIGDKIISNYLHGITQIPVDWPQAPSI